MSDNRDEFREKDKVIIAKRAGYLCSFPGCGSITVSASEESDLSTSSSGMACHISAAASGKNAKRYNSDLSPEQRSHPNNGIWMCYKHGKIVDTDETRFTTEILEHWKEIAKNTAILMHDKGISYSKALKYIPKNLAHNEIIIDDLNGENQIIGDALIDSCIPVTWGNKLNNALRDFLIEYSRNSIIHGKGDKIELNINYNRITIIDNGANFDIRTLLTMENGRGGKLSYSHLLEKYAEEIILTTRRENKKNIIIISKLNEPEEILELTPCAIQISLSEFKYGINYEIHETCNDLFIVLPKYFTLSDLPRVHKKDKLMEEQRPITFIGENLSEMVIWGIKEKYPDSKIIQVE
jgi:hypothetical protein